MQKTHRTYDLLFGPAVFPLARGKTRSFYYEITMKIEPREGLALTSFNFHSSWLFRPACLARKSMMTLTGRRPVKVIMRLQLANQAKGLIGQLSIAWPFGPCSEPGPKDQANSAPSGPHKPKYRGPKDRS